MGNCCSCCKGDEEQERRQEEAQNEEEDERSPLLPGQAPKGPTTAPKALSDTPDVVVKQPQGTPKAGGSSRRSKKEQKVEVRRHLNVDERGPLNVDLCQVKKVDDEFAAVINSYNTALELVNNLRGIRDTLLVECQVSTKTLNAVLAFLKEQLGGDMTLKLERDDSGDLELRGYDEDAAPPAPNPSREHMTMVRASIQLVSQLEMVEKNDDNRTVTRALRVVSREKDMELAVLQAKHGADGPDCMRNCKHGLKQVRLVSERWTMVMYEKDDLIEEFLESYQHLMQEPMDLTREMRHTKHEIKIEVEKQEQASSEEGAVRNWLENRGGKAPKESSSPGTSLDLIVVDEADDVKDQPTEQKEEVVEQEEETEEQKEETEEQKDETEEQKEETGDQNEETQEQKEETGEQKEETEEQKEETGEQNEETAEQKEETQEQKEETEEQKEETGEPQEESAEQKEETEQKTEEPKEETQEQKEEHKGEGDVQKSDENKEHGQ